MKEEVIVGFGDLEVGIEVCWFCGYISRMKMSFRDFSIFRIFCVFWEKYYGRFSCRYSGINVLFVF